MPYTISTGPAAEPITLDEAKKHLKVETTDDDQIIEIYLAGARQQVEKYLNRALMPQTIKQYFDNFKSCTLEFRFAPVQSVTSLKYFDSDDAEQTLTVNDDYRVDLISEPGKITPVNSWPATKAKPNAVTLEYVAGYADHYSVPENIKCAILMLLGERYENRENFVKRLPTAVRHILDLEKVML